MVFSGVLITCQYVGGRSGYYAPEFSNAAGISGQLAWSEKLAAAGMTTNTAPANAGREGQPQPRNRQQHGRRHFREHRPDTGHHRWPGPLGPSQRNPERLLPVRRQSGLERSMKPRSSRQKSALSNGNRPFLKSVPVNSEEARRYKDILDDLIAEPTRLPQQRQHVARDDGASSSVRRQLHAGRAAAHHRCADRDRRSAVLRRGGRSSFSA